MKLALAALLLLSSVAPAAQAYESQAGYARDQKCYKRVYKETYVPGTMKNPGYVKTEKKRVRVPCEKTGEVYYIPAEPVYHHNHQHRTRRPAQETRGHVDDNSCIEGSILGGIAGGGIGAAASRKEGRLWAIPLGIVGGALVGCQVDGG